MFSKYWLQKRQNIYLRCRKQCLGGYPIAVQLLFDYIFAFPESIRKRAYVNYRIGFVVPSNVVVIVNR